MVLDEGKLRNNAHVIGVEHHKGTVVPGDQVRTGCAAEDLPVVELGSQILHPVTGDPQGGIVNYFGLRSNEKALGVFYSFCIGCAFKSLNRRGGKRRSFNWVEFRVDLKKSGVALPEPVVRRLPEIVIPDRAG